MAEPRAMQIALLSDDWDELKELLSKKTKQIDQVLLSSGGHFLIWYTTDGEEAITKKHAQTLAESLESTVDAYEELTGCSYSFQPVKTGNFTVSLAEQKALAKLNGIDPDTCLKTMHVYVCNYNSNENIAATYHYFTDDPKTKALFEGLTAAASGVRGVTLWPCITYKPANADGVNSRQIINHELFHHFQAYVLPGHSEAYRTGNHDDYGAEATADWASALVTENSGYTNAILNGHARTYVKLAHNLLDSKEYTTLRTVKNSDGDLYERCDIGYYLFPLVFNYQNNVSDGTSKILKAIYADSFLSSLESSSTKEERLNLMTDLMLHNLNNDYDNYNVRAKEGTVPVIKTLSEKTGKKDETINRAMIHYYRLKGEENEYLQVDPEERMNLLFKNQTVFIDGTVFNLDSRQTFFRLMEEGWEDIQQDAESTDYQDITLQPGEILTFSLIPPGKEKRFGVTVDFYNMKDTAEPLSKASVIHSSVYLSGSAGLGHTEVVLTDRSVLGDAFDPVSRFGNADKITEDAGQTVYSYGDGKVCLRMEDGCLRGVDFSIRN